MAIRLGTRRGERAKCEVCCSTAATCTRSVMSCEAVVLGRAADCDVVWSLSAQGHRAGLEWLLGFG